MPLEMLLELVEQGEGVGDRAREPGDDLVAIHPPDLGGAVLHDHLADGDLTVAGDGHLVAALDPDDGGGAQSRHARAEPAGAAAALGGR